MYTKCLKRATPHRSPGVHLRCLLMCEEPLKRGLSRPPLALQWCKWVPVPRYPPPVARFWHFVYESSNIFIFFMSKQRAPNEFNKVNKVNKVNCPMRFVRCLYESFRIFMFFMSKQRAPNEVNKMNKVNKVNCAERVC